MNKIERVTNALNGYEVDRPPFSFWYHFGLQHMPGEVHAEAELDFYRAYDLDFLKVMSDYPYPLPGGLDALANAEDLRRLEPIKPSNKAWNQQLSAISIINEGIGKEALFIETIFSTWTTARRLSRTGVIPELRQRDPETLLAAFQAISESLAGYASAAVDRGAAGIFLSLGGATDEVMTVEEYEIWGRPFDLKILDAVRDAPFNVLHIHGKRIHFDSLLDYPVGALNWSHFATEPSLREGKERSGKTVLGGIDEARASHVSGKELAEQAYESISEVGTRGLIVTPGCSVPTDTREHSLRQIKSAVERARKPAL